MPNTKAVILAAGLGTRLRPLTDRIAKCLVPIADRALLDYWLIELVRAGVRDVLINTHAHREAVVRHLEAVNQRGGQRITETYEPELRGSAGTIAANAGFADTPDAADAVIIIYADNFSAVDLGDMLAYHESHDDPMTMLLFHSPTPHTCGIAELDADHRIVSFVEKPAQPVSDLANAGVYVLDAAAYREVAAMGAFDFGFDVLPKFVGRMRGWTLGGYHRDIGSPEAYEAVQADAPAVLAERGYVAGGRRPAVFFDRDGTLIEPVPYLSNPDHVELSPGAAASIRRLHEAGFAAVVVTNQSAIGRGMFDEARLREIHERMSDLFAAEGSVLDAIHHCPRAPVRDDRTVIEHEDRKPGPGMLKQAARELGLDLQSSWMVGDMISDILAGENAGCRGNILLEGVSEVTQTERRAAGEFESATDLKTAAGMILEAHHAVAGARGSS